MNGTRTVAATGALVVLVTGWVLMTGSAHGAPTPTPIGPTPTGSVLTPTEAMPTPTGSVPSPYPTDVSPSPSYPVDVVPSPVTTSAPFTG